MDTFTRSLVDVGFARLVASALYDSTQNCESVTSAELAESIGFLDSVETAVDKSLAAHPIVKSTGKARERETVRDGIVLERKGLLSTLVGLGAFDGLVTDDNGNPVSFCSRIGIYGGFARVGDVPPKTEKKEGEKRGKNPDAWKAVPPVFVERMKRLLETLTASENHVTCDNLVVAMMKDAGRDPMEFIQSGDYKRWSAWVSLTREGNPALQDEKGRPLYDTLQGRTGGLKRAEYPVETTATAATAATVETTETALLEEVVEAEAVVETESSETASEDSGTEFTEVPASES